MEVKQLLKNQSTYGQNIDMLIKKDNNLTVSMPSLFNFDVIKEVIVGGFWYRVKFRDPKFENHKEVYYTCMFNIN